MLKIGGRCKLAEKRERLELYQSMRKSCISSFDKLLKINYS